MVDSCQFEYLSGILTEFDEIWYIDADSYSEYGHVIKIQNLKIQNGGHRTKNVFGHNSATHWPSASIF